MMNDYDSDDLSEGESSESDNAAKECKEWIHRLTCADEEAECFLRQAKEAYTEYTFSQSNSATFKWESSANQHIPLFWATIQTQKPAAYGQVPTPIIERRFDDKDPVARVASEGAQRACRSLIDRSRFDKVMSRITQDFLIAGKGVGRVYYEAELAEPEKIYIDETTQIPENVKIEEDEVGQYYLDEPEVATEKVVPVWVSYENERHSPGARDYSDIEFKSYDHYYTKKQFAKIFGQELEEQEFDWKSKIPFCYTSRRDKTDDDVNQDKEYQGQFARITEAWDLTNRECVWLCREFSGRLLRKSPDIYGLVPFFPSPEPVQTTIGDKVYYPIPDYVQYRQALRNIDFLANRARRLIKAIRVKGVYDKNTPEIQRLLGEANETDLVPADMIRINEKGTLANLIQFAETEPLVAALIQTYDGIDRQKQIIYEITGQSDITRGASKASESATAQQIKRESSSIRGEIIRKELDRLARDLIELMLDLALAKFSDKTWYELAGIAFLPQEDQALWPQALVMLKTDKFRTFRIKIDTDSTLLSNTQAERDSRIELLGRFTEFFGQLTVVGSQAPELLPAMAEAGLYTIRSLSQSSGIEGITESSIEAYKERILNPAPAPDPMQDPAYMLEQQKTQAMADKLGVEQEKNNLQAQIADGKAQVDLMKVENERTKLENQQKLDILKIQNEREKFAIEREKIAADERASKLAATVDMLIAKMETLSEQQIQVSESQPSVSQSTESKQPMIFNIGGGTKVGGWVDTPEGRKMMIQTIPENGAVS